MQWNLIMKILNLVYLYFLRHKTILILTNMCIHPTHHVQTGLMGKQRKERD